MKLLFITHSLNFVYGAARSLHLLLKSIPDHYDVMFQKRILKQYSIEEVREFVGPKCDSVFFCDLPTDYSMMEYKIWNKTNSIFQNVKEVGSVIKRTFLYLINRNQIMQIIKAGNYDCIHVNSSVMYPLLSDKFYMTIHIRELLPLRISHFAKKRFKKAKALICIEEVVKRHLINCCHGINESLIHVISNPFDMSSVNSIDVDSVLKKYKLMKSSTIFTIAGSITNQKGVDFVIDSFIESNCVDKVLLVVGDENTKFCSILKNKCHDYPSIRFLGEQPNMNDIYAISDYVVRGEAEFCTGRTVYEALFSGCSVILPGIDSNIGDGIFLPDQIDRVFFYLPRDNKALSYLFSTLVKSKKKGFVSSNTKDYYMAFYQSILGKCNDCYVRIK